MKSNRLRDETSPYLLQHAHNPVDWYPWGQEALDRARTEDRPILLSIGYSACHWCHVMERESFENSPIADLMNKHFVSIKVDREERPDLDQIYMNAVQAMTGSGGWPLTVFLTPDARPFYGGTYFPPEDRYGRPGFPRVLQTIAEAYRDRRQAISENAEALMAQLKAAATSPAPAGILDAPFLESASRQIIARGDTRNGGFGGAPKFPQAMTLEFLLRRHARTGREDVAPIVELSLDRMARGGIYDQAGGGFHRYSVDDRWLVPHFEKMLYDNALLGSAYLAAYQLFGKPLYRRIVSETLDFVLRELTAPNGGFYSALDADSEGVEGKFYVWTFDEFNEAAGDDAALLAKYFDVSAAGNFEHQNILNVPRDPDLFAKLENTTDLQERARRTLDVLLERRQHRIRPGRDEKVLTDWNGLMLRTLSDSAVVLNRSDYLEAARKNASFLLDNLWDGTNLLHSFKDGRARFNGYLDDYANLADGLISLYSATFESRWLDYADQLVSRMLDQFWDDDNGGFFFTGKSHEQLITRTKDWFDNATPSGNSVAASVLLHLGTVHNRPAYRSRAEAVLQAASALVQQYPTGFGRMLSSMDFYVGPTRELAIVGEPAAFLHVVRSRFRPNLITVAGTEQDLPLLQGRTLIGGKPAAYLCENYSCQQPVSDPEDLRRLLGD